MTISSCSLLIITWPSSYHNMVHKIWASKILLYGRKFKFNWTHFDWVLDKFIIISEYHFLSEMSYHERSNRHNGFILGKGFKHQNQVVRCGWFGAFVQKIIVSKIYIVQKSRCFNFFLILMITVLDDYVKQLDAIQLVRCGHLWGFIFQNLSYLNHIHKMILRSNYGSRKTLRK